jgi:hypothetical protein
VKHLPESGQSDPPEVPEAETKEDLAQAEAEQRLFEDKERPDGT